MLRRGNAWLGRARRGTRRAAVALAAVIALAGCGALGPAALVGPPAGRTTGRSGTSRTTAAIASGPLACTPPRLPAAGRAGSGSPGGPLGGPALRALRGGAARSAFSLDGGRLRVSPPLPGQSPAIPAREVECAALASLNIDNVPLLGAALQRGIALGYGRVTVAAGLPHAPTVVSLGGTAPTAAHLPSAAAYRGRLAWVVVVRPTFGYHCPMMREPLPRPAARAKEPPHYGYTVFLLGASSGTHALLYNEGHPQPCGFSGWVGPEVNVPALQRSVPWHLVARSPDGYSGRIQATVRPCDGFPHSVLVSQNRPAVRVLVLAPVSAQTCGPVHAVTLRLQAATVTADLPAHIAHDRVGLYLPLPARPAPSASPPTVLHNLGPTDAGRTLHVRVGAVLVVTPWPGLIPSGPSGPSPVRSSDAAVLGPLDGANLGPVAEFRAWKPGRADLSIPATACRSPHGGLPPCSGPWVVHVVVG